MAIPHIVLEEIEQLKSEGEYDKALRKVNGLLSRDPTNREALYQVADIEYRRGEITKAEKPVDFLLQSQSDDAMGWYIK
jgi:DNA-binding SARP family transcriptional activator